MVMLRMDTARHFGCVLPITVTRSWSIDSEATRFSSIKPSRIGSSLQFQAFTILMPIDYELTCYRPRSFNCILALATLQALKEPETQSKIIPRMKNETQRTLRPMLKLRRKSPGAPLSQTHQMTRLKARSLEPPIS